MNDPIQSPKRPSTLGQSALFFIGGALLGGMLASGFFMNRVNQAAVSTDDVVGESLFKVDKNLYSSNNLPGDSAMSYYQLESSIYDAKSNFVNQIALRLALAKDNPKAVAAAKGELPSLDELLNVSAPTDAEVKAYYNTILSRYGEAVFGGQSYDAVKAQLSQQLEKQKRDQKIQEKVQEYVSTGRIEPLLSKPEAPSVKLDLTGYPVRGNADSSITLVEVSDYMCPHCRETEPIVNKMYKEFGNKVKFVQITFPLNPKGLNGALARGAYCANQQGSNQFWKYHEQAFAVPWDKMNPPQGKDAETYFNVVASDAAKRADINVNKFNSCLESKDAAQYITHLQSEFNAEKGFQGTPTFYLNNKLIQANPAQLESTLRTTLSKMASE